MCQYLFLTDYSENRGKNNHITALSFALRVGKNWKIESDMKRERNLKIS